MGIFVDQNDEVEIVVHYKESGERIEVFEGETAPDGYDVLTARFRKPSYEDTVAMSSKGVVVSGEGVAFNSQAVDFTRIIILLKSWSLDIEPSAESVARLHPAIGQAIARELSKKLGLPILGEEAV